MAFLLGSLICYERLPLFLLTVKIKFIRVFNHFLLKKGFHMQAMNLKSNLQIHPCNIFYLMPTTFQGLF